MIEIPDGATAWQMPFTIHDPISGDACNADSTPTVAFRYTDGASNGDAYEIVGTVSNIATGLYVLSLDFDSAGPAIAAYAYTPIITAIVRGITQKAPLEPFRVGFLPVWGAVVSDGSNTATAFKVSGAFDDTIDDSLKEALLVFLMGINRSQMRPVSAYNATTGFVTVGQGGFPSAPTAGDRFLVVFK